MSSHATKLEIVPLNAIPRVLYHYCPSTSFDWILRSKTLRLTDSKYLNDYTECTWFEQILDAVFKLDHDDTCTETGRMFSDYKLFHDKATFIAAFSEDGDLLSQWCRYAEDGMGYCIGFDMSDLDYLFMTRSDDSWFDGAGILKVIYDEPEQTKLVRNAVKVWNHNYCRLAPGDIRESAIGQGAYSFSVLSRVIKNPSFREEKEWRLVYMPEFDKGVSPRGRGRGSFRHPGVMQSIARTRIVEGHFIPHVGPEVFPTCCNELALVY